ncbi:hypothetical protein ACIQAC_08935 [Streptomyces sp. NPDC088387]|uniref:hypothetical protein n=1 Tax=Streptomyces sp. NPDC088387 TaxID=3365859 RepID=UPI00381B881C
MSATTMSLAQVVLFSGRTIELTELRQSSTYGGMPEGYPSYPCRPVNGRRINTLLYSAERCFPAHPVHLVPPPLEHPDVPAGPFGRVEVLPAVACVGVFHSTPITATHDPVLHRSALTIVWFQATARIPTGREADGGLLGVAWDRLAADYER